MFKIIGTIDGFARETILKPWYLKHGLHRQRQAPAHAPRKAGDQTTTDVTKVLWLLLGKSPKQPFPVKSFCCSLSLEEQPQNFRDISGRLNQHPRLKLWFIICLLEFAAAGIMLMLSAENVLSSVIVPVGF